jgi:hypothetical protein
MLVPSSIGLRDAIDLRRRQRWKGRLLLKGDGPRVHGSPPLLLACLPELSNRVQARPCEQQLRSKRCYPTGRSAPPQRQFCDVDLDTGSGRVRAWQWGSDGGCRNGRFRTARLFTERPDRRAHSDSAFSARHLIAGWAHLRCTAVLGDFGSSVVRHSGCHPVYGLWSEGCPWDLVKRVGGTSAMARAAGRTTGYESR